MKNNFVTLSKSLAPYHKRRLLLFLLKHDSYARYLENFIEQNCLVERASCINIDFTCQFSSRYKAITYAFTWGATKEGYSYWNEIANKYLEFITQPHNTRNKRLNIF